jgi:hypothetical protein
MSTRLVENEIRRFLADKEPEVTCITVHWGVGKTFAWNKHLKEAQKLGKIGLARYSYVSLFGVTSLDDLKYAIFENTVQSSEIGEPTFETLKRNIHCCPVTVRWNPANGLSSREMNGLSRFFDLNFFLAFCG